VADYTTTPKYTHNRTTRYADLLFFVFNVRAVPTARPQSERAPLSLPGRERPLHLAYVSSQM